MADETDQPQEAFEAGEPPARPRRQRDDDRGDDRPRRRRPAPDDGVSTLIPYRNVLALVGYYLGVFSLIPCLGLLLGPAAIVLGILGLKHVKKKPEAKGTGHAITAIVLGTLTTILNFGALALMFSASLWGRR